MIFDLNPNKIFFDVNNIDLIVILPLYNEEKNIENVINEWIIEFNKLNIRYSFLIINDGSTDNSFSIINNLKINNIFIVNKLNSGHGSSCRYGYEIVSRFSKKWVLQIDSDGQCRPENFEKFWEKRNDFDVLFGRRINRKDGLIRFINSYLCIFLCKVFFKMRIDDPNVPFRLIKTNLLTEFTSKISTSINLQNIALSIFISKIDNIKITNINIDFPRRTNDISKTNFSEIFRLGINLLFDFKRL